jgi:hypothetical protein
MEKILKLISCVVILSQAPMMEGVARLKLFDQRLNTVYMKESRRTDKDQ